jgi:tripartite ATP-independent transporter DctM subunit
VLFHSGVAPDLLDAIDKWLGRLPGRLNLIAVAGGTLFATLTGVSMGSVALLGAVLQPEMEKRGYQKSLTMGAIMGSGSLAVMIPPSTLAVLLGAIGLISVGKILIAIIIPGLLLAVVFVAYIIIRCWLQPDMAPTYEVAQFPLREKLKATVIHILPVGLVIFLVIGIMMLGVATPTEAAASGALGTFLLVAIHKKLSWQMTKKALFGTLNISVMIMLIIAGTGAFGQVLAYTGASAGLARFAVNLPLAPILTVVAMQVVLFVLGMFIAAIPIMMITLPIFIPIVNSLGFDPVWFAVLFLLNMEMAGISPPFGLNLFAMKSVASADTKMEEVFRSALPFIGCDALALVLVLFFPELALWLPGLMY